MNSLAEKVRLTSIGSMSKDELYIILDEMNEQRGPERIDMGELAEKIEMFLSESRYCQVLGIDYSSGKGPLSEERLQVASYLLIKESLDLIH